MVRLRLNYLTIQGARLSMEMEAVKTWLSRGREIRRELEALEQSKMNLYLRAVSVTQRYDGEAVSGTKDPHKLDGYAAYVDLVDRHAAKLAEVSGEIFRVIIRVSDGKERAILIHRYLSALHWREIALAMGYDVRHVYRLHGTALLSVKKILEE